MLQTFRELSRDMPGASVHFWSVVLRDVFCSVAREHIDAWTCGMGRLALDWVLACSLGAIASGVVTAIFITSVSVLFPPRIDAQGAVDIVATNLPPGVYGALIGFVIGSAQALALRHHLRRGMLWIVGTSVAGAAGFQLGLALANSIGFRVLPIGYFAGITLLGALVGATQSLFLKGEVRSPVRWMLWSALAIPAGILVGIASNVLFRADPRTWQGLALAFALFPAVIGFVVGVLTVRPLTASLSQRDLMPAGGDARS
jgi:hypothetical protein